MRRLYDLLRRRRLAYELLDAHDRKPDSLEDALQRLIEFATSGNPPSFRDSQAARTWAEAALARKEHYAP